MSKKKSVFLSFNIFYFLILFTPIAISMFYPIELETRESTLWLHVMTLKNGISLYDQNLVAYANHAHGPIDPLFKYVISSFFSFLEPWQVSRISNFLFFIFIYILFFCILKKFKFNLNIILFLSSLFFSLILLFTKGYQGRADATALFFFLILIFGVINYSNSNFFIYLLNPILSSLIIMTNWRFTHIVLVVSTFIFFKKFMENLEFRKIEYKSFIIYFFIFLVFPTIFLYFEFNLDISKYNDYFFNFFYFKSHFDLNFLLNGFQSLFKVEKFFVLIILCFLILHFVITREFEVRKKFFFLLVFFTIFIITLFQYLYNYTGGGIYYFTPIILITFFLFFVSLRDFNFYQNLISNFYLKNILILLILLIVVSAAKFSISSSYYMIKTLPKAIEMHNYLVKFDNTGALSESLHFHKKKYSNEKIDIGDLLSYRSRQVGGDYLKTYQSHINDIKMNHFTYIIHNFAGSSEISSLIKKKIYVILKKFDESYFHSNLREVLVLKKNILSK